MKKRDDRFFICFKNKQISNFMPKKLAAFSLVEIMVSLVVVSIVVAAFAPVVTKKLSASTIRTTGGGIGKGGMSFDCADIPYCMVCNSSATKCIGCETGYYLKSDDTCGDCTTDFNAITCSADGAKKCSSPTQLYIGDDKKCHDCSDFNALTCDKNGAKTCNTGSEYIADDKKCHNCSDFNALTCDKNGAKTCEAGKYVDSNTKNCETCPEDHYCLGGNKTKTACAAGKYTAGLTGRTKAADCVARFTSEEFTSNGEFTVPNGVTKIKVTLVGGGTGGTGGQGPIVKTVTKTSPGEYSLTLPSGTKTITYTACGAGGTTNSAAWAPATAAGKYGTGGKGGFRKDVSFTTTSTTLKYIVGKAGADASSTTSSCAGLGGAGGSACSRSCHKEVYGWSYNLTQERASAAGGTGGSIYGGAGGLNAVCRWADGTGYACQGGAGGKGGGATVVLEHCDNKAYIAAGGGGGGGGTCGNSTVDGGLYYTAGGGGGGGGGAGGGAGGAAAWSSSGKDGGDGENAWANDGSFGSSNCGSGQHGAIKITYPSTEASAGGAGGACGKVFTKTLTVSGNQVYTITIGSGGAGGAAGPAAASGNAGSAGSAGSASTIKLNTNTTEKATSNSGSAGAAGGAASNSTGGAGCVLTGYDNLGNGGKGGNGTQAGSNGNNGYVLIENATVYAQAQPSAFEKFKIALIEKIEKIKYWIADLFNLNKGIKCKVCKR